MVVYSKFWLWEVLDSDPVGAVDLVGKVALVGAEGFVEAVGNGGRIVGLEAEHR